MSCLPLLLLLLLLLTIWSKGQTINNLITTPVPFTSFKICLTTIPQHFPFNAPLWRPISEFEYLSSELFTDLTVGTFHWDCVLGETFQRKRGKPKLSEYLKVNWLMACMLMMLTKITTKARTEARCRTKWWRKEHGVSVVDYCMV